MLNISLGDINMELFVIFAAVAVAAWFLYTRIYNKKSEFNTNKDVNVKTDEVKPTVQPTLSEVLKDPVQDNNVDDSGQVAEKVKKTAKKTATKPKISREKVVKKNKMTVAK